MIASHHFLCLRRPNSDVFGNEARWGHKLVSLVGDLLLGHRMKDPNYSNISILGKRVTAVI